MANFIVIDTEGVITGNRNSRNIGAESSAYDIGFIIANSNGEILDKYSFINTDVFYQDSVMETAYYADKLPQYHEGIGLEWVPLSLLSIHKIFTHCIKTYNARKVWAYNASYDRDSLNRTITEASNGFLTEWLPSGCRWADIWDYAGETLCSTSKYVKWCFEHSFVSPKGNPKTNADTVGKYVTQNLDFVEQHTALADCEIELQILQKCLKQHRKCPTSMGQGWRKAAAQAKKLSKVK